jgi:hypothetical protein
MEHHAAAEYVKVTLWGKCRVFNSSSATCCMLYTTAEQQCSVDALMNYPVVSFRGAIASAAVLHISKANCPAGPYYDSVGHLCKQWKGLVALGMLTCESWPPLVFLWVHRWVPCRSCKAMQQFSRWTVTLLHSTTDCLGRQLHSCLAC